MIMSLDGGGGRVQFYWNPQTIETNKDTKWNHLAAAGREQDILQYSCGAPIYYQFEVDLTRAGGESYVKDTTEKLLEMCKPSVKGAGVDRPPRVKLILGQAINATCIIASVSSKYGPLYDPGSLNPYFGKLTLKLVEIKND